MAYGHFDWEFLLRKLHYMGFGPKCKGELTNASAHIHSELIKETTVKLVQENLRVKAR